MSRLRVDEPDADGVAHEPGDAVNAESVLAGFMSPLRSAPAPGVKLEANRQGTPHSAFTDPRHAHVAPRESIEVRALAMFR